MAPSRRSSTYELHDHIQRRMTHLLALPSGHELAGDYRIDRVLGAGGFGITYLADEMALARRVTIKEYFPSDFAHRNEALEAVPRSQTCAPDYRWGLDRFIEEAQTLARFDHRNIVRVYRYFRANNTGYMVLQFEQGTSLKAWLKGLGRRPRQNELDQIVAPLLDALETIHKADFLHRDIAPDNVIIRSDGSPVLIDFGSARRDLAQASQTVSALVKPGYSPYEQYAETGRQQGPWTDIYALSVTLYHAVTDRRPPDAPSRVIKDELVPAREAALGSYRPKFLTAIDRALALDIERRPPSIAAWRGDLLAPQPQQKKGARVWNGLGRKPAGPSTAESEATTRPLTREDAATTPPPPDAPGRKGRRLAYIDGLKRKTEPRSVSLFEQAVSPAPPPKREPLPNREPPPRPVSLFEHAGSPEPPPKREPPPRGEAVAEALPQALPVPVPVRPAPVPAPRKAPRPRRIRSAASRHWRPLAVKLLIGVAIASAAVAVQNRMPRVDTRGAGATATSQSSDLQLLGQIPGHKGSINA